ncbi:Hypothetical protein R9X50_00097000 [Acrodontium crateriforme]|uniref:Cytochrome b mRNA-processing protein 4 n=1 Tax=Acrodontium crateriforme TaxID=150365 RepID=A0AAQ3R7P2_9PEZI|nr:Hypothetical protein R9X50_00097000 [Acrodontium crateriforme]
MRTYTWAKMLVGGAAMCIGGPALVYWVMPTEEELFKRYNPELQARSLANRQERQQEFDDFVGRLKGYSKSNKTVWAEWEQDAERRRKAGVQAELDRRQAEAIEAETRKAEMKKSLGSS